MKNKICTKCKIKKSLDEFSLNKKYQNGLSYWCKLCCKKTNKEYHKKFPWKRVFNNIKQRCNNLNEPAYKDYGGRGIKCLITEKEIKKLWFRDKAWKLKQPSIDKIDNNGNYTFKNCRFIEKSLNSSKDKGKGVNQYDLDGNFIKTWKSQSEIQRILDFNQTNISRVCSGTHNKARGFIWKFANKEK